MNDELKDIQIVSKISNKVETINYYKKLIILLHILDNIN